MLIPLKLLHGGPSDKFGRSTAQRFEFGNPVMTCGECTIFQNNFCYRQSHQKVDDSESETSSEDDESENDIDAAVKDIETIEENISTLATSFLAGVEHDSEVIIESAHHHVHQSRSMRGLVQLKTQLAIQLLLDQKHHPERDCMVVCDFAQNLPLPHYGSKQPGEIYFLSALTIHLFASSIFPSRLTNSHATFTKNQQPGKEAIMLHHC
jgi:hypothetical protein